MTDKPNRDAQLATLQNQADIFARVLSIIKDQDGASEHLMQARLRLEEARLWATAHIQAMKEAGK